MKTKKEPLTEEEIIRLKNLQAYKAKMRAIIRRDGLIKINNLMEYFKDKSEGQLVLVCKESKLSRLDMMNCIKSVAASHQLKLKMRHEMSQKR